MRGKHRYENQFLRSFTTILLTTSIKERWSHTYFIRNLIKFSFPKLSMSKMFLSQINIKIVKCLDSFYAQSAGEKK